MKINKSNSLMIAFTMAFSLIVNAQYEWSNIAVPANAGSGNSWDLVESLSDDFSYSSSFGSGGYANRSNFGSNNQWYNFYHNAWDGPGYTYWNTSNVSVDGDNLVITAGHTPQNSKGGSYGVASGCVTSNSKVTYPVYVESSVSVANISLASCFWLLSPDDTEEIDIIENYGGVDFFKNFTHISHHSFVRDPFTDYQPRDWNSWHEINEITNAGGWGEFCWNGGNRRYMRMGVNWIGPKHWEYYIDGDLVRVMYYNAMASKVGNSWEYTYYNSTFQDPNGYYFPTNGSDGYSLVTTHATENNYNFSTLQAASNASNGYSVIDTGWFQGGDDNDVDGNGVTEEARGFTKSLDIIINIESQNWLLNSTPSQGQLNDPARNKMLVDWVRVYKPVSGGGNTDVAVTGVNLTPATLTLNVGATGNVTGAVIPSNATDQTMTFSSSDTSVATVNQSGVVTAISAGVAIITATTTDGDKTDTSTVTVTSGGTNPPSNGQTPFGGTARTIPGTINSIDFDNGGAGVAYNDTTSGNTGSGARQDTDVDTENRTSGGNVGWIAAGEWLEYTVNVATAGTYTIDVAVASTNNNGAFHIEFNGANITGNQSVSSTGSWGTFVNKTISNVQLLAGQQVMRVFMDGGSFNLGPITFTAIAGGIDTGGAAGYYLVNRSNGQKLLSPNNTNGASLTLAAASTTSDYARWTRVNSSNGFSYHLNAGSGMYFRPGSGAVNSPIQQRPTSWSGFWTQWIDEPTTDGYFRLRNRATNDFLGYNGSNAVHTNLTNSTTEWIWVDSGANARQQVALSSGEEEIKDQERIKIYPNPANDHITVLLEGYNTIDTTELTILDIQGKIFYKRIFRGNTSKVNTSKFNNGMYLIQLKTSKSTTFSKLVIE